MPRRIAFFGFLVGLVLLIQMPAIQRPFLGHFASYQLVMASMARNMARENFTQLLLPKTDMLVNGERALHLNQYPFPSLAAAAGVRFLGGSFEFWGRFQAILFNLLSSLLLGLIAARLFRNGTEKMAPLIYLLSPYTLIYGQCFMSETMSLCFLLAALYLFLRSGDSGGKGVFLLIFSAAAFSIALTGRIHFLVILPLFAGRILLSSDSRKFLKLFLFIFVSLALPAAWYGYTWFASAHSDHVLTNIFLQFTGRKVADQHYLTNLDYYRRLFDIFSQTMLTPLFFPFLFLGLALIPKRSEQFWITFGGLLLSICIAVFLPQKVMAHDFYLYPVFPFLVLLTAYGVTRALDTFPNLKTGVTPVAFLLISLAVSSRYFLHPVFKPAPGELSTFRKAQIIKEKTQPEDRLIIAAESTAIFSYYADRPAALMGLGLLGKDLPYYFKNQASGAPLQEAMKDPIRWFEFLKKQGASYFVLPDLGEAGKIQSLLDYLDKNYRRVSSSVDDFYLFSLKTPAAKEILSKPTPLTSNDIV